MAERRAVVGSKIGLHARPAARFVKAAAKQPVKVTIARAGGDPGRPGPVAAMQQLFVYGTLRLGQANHERLLAGAVAWHRPAVLPGHQLLVAGLPFAADATDGGQVHGDLLGLVAERYQSLLRTLDHFEGYRPADPHGSLYVREERQVAYCGDDGRMVTVPAWVYLAGPLALRDLAASNRVPGGDWLGPAGG